MLIAAALHSPRAPLSVTAADGRAAPALAMASMSGVERQRLLRALEELGDRLDARAHPLADDFDDTPVGAALDRELGTRCPRLTAARALYGANVVDPWARGGSTAERRARFSAWAVSGAAIVRFADADAARAAARQLRARAGERDSRIALVVADGGIDPALVRELVAVRAAAARVAARLPVDDERRALLDDVAHATSPSPRCRRGCSSTRASSSSYRGSAASPCSTRSWRKWPRKSRARASSCARARSISAERGEGSGEAEGVRLGVQLRLRLRIKIRVG